MQVTEVEMQLNMWNKKVEQLHKDYKWLLFFRIPKLMHLSKHFEESDSECNVGCILQEIGFLLQRYCEKQVLFRDIKVR